MRAVCVYIIHFSSKMFVIIASNLDSNTTNCLLTTAMEYVYYLQSGACKRRHVVSSGGHPWLYPFLEAFPRPNDCSQSMALCFFVERAGGVSGTAFGSGSLQHPNYFLENGVLDYRACVDHPPDRGVPSGSLLFLDIAQWVESKT